MIVAPIFLKRSASSGGMASAPDAHTRTEVRSRSVGAGLVEHPVHGGHADEHRRPALLDGVEHLHRVELRQQVRGDAGAGQADQRRRSP